MPTHEHQLNVAYYMMDQSLLFLKMHLLLLYLASAQVAANMHCEEWFKYINQTRQSQDS